MNYMLLTDSVSFDKLCAVKLLRFQWQAEMELFTFKGPGFISISR